MKAFPIQREVAVSARARLGLTQEAIARNAGVSLRIVVKAENGGRISPFYICCLAEAYGVSPYALSPEAFPDAPPFLHHQISVPTSDPDVLSKLILAATLDMTKKYAEAIRILDQLIRTAPESALELKAYLHLRKATSLDNAGEHAAALAELEIPGSWEFRSVSLRDGIIYHRALARLHMGQWKEAIPDLERLTRGTGKFIPSAQHQLGNIALLEARRLRDNAKGSKSPKGIAALLAAAEASFQKAHSTWLLEGNFRAGYSARRLAEIEEMRGNPDTALRFLLEALALFARHDCVRYEEETRTSIVVLFARSRP